MSQTSSSQTSIPQNNTTLTFKNGISMPNRFMLAPLTNSQSHDDGTLSDDEYHWLTKRAEGGFGLTMTCASHVQFVGKGFAGQLGIYDDAHIEGHQRLAKTIKANNSLAIIQLHHAGMRSPEDQINQQPVSASPVEKYNTRGLSLTEVHQLRDDFIAAAIRAQKCGYDGVEVHGAHGYILTQFLSADINKRNDQYGGTLENRARLLFEIITGIRSACGKDFLLGVRLSPERFGMQIGEAKTLCQLLVNEHDIDFLDLSLWDVFKHAIDEDHNDKTLLQHFTELDYKDVKLTVAGNITTGKDVQAVLNAGVDFVTIGRSAILHHDFPKQVMANPDFTPVALPVSAAHLRKEGLSETFVTYMKRWEGFVQE
jgi:2,4-dienoyl-CoA reductase-like NADH-dependent reductase (Old Yellow Enzyme family)